MTETGGQATGGWRSMLDNMVGVSDMVLLEPLTEDALIENLWDRYNNKDIYVSNNIYLSVYHHYNDALGLSSGGDHCVLFLGQTFNSDL